MRVDRRTLLIGGGVGVGLTVAFLAWPRDTIVAPPTERGEQAFNAFLKITSDGRATIAMPQAEAGQGVWTALAQVLADQLGAAWEQVAVEPAPPGAPYVNRLLGARMTAGSTSIRAFAGPFAAAGKAARAMLVAAAARRWGVDPSSCTVGGGFVRSGNRSAGFGELAEEAAALDPGGDPGRLSARLTGQSLPRLDLPAKSDGSLRFAGDVRLPDMLFAAARLAPPGGRLAGFDRAALRGKRHVATDGWIAVLDSNWWAAEQALKAARVRFTGPSVDIDRALEKALESGDFQRIAERGDFASAVGSARALAATYRIAPAPHLGLEPLAAVARWRGGRLEVWAATQAHDQALAAAAQAGQVDAAAVTLYPMPVGDSGGRAIEADAIPIAVDLARRTNRPVSLTLSPSVSHNLDRMRAPLVARMAAMPDSAGGVKAWSARFATVDELADWSEEGRAGAVPPYAIETVRVTATEVGLPIPFGYMRGGVEALTGFANECFVDELARALGREPSALRIGMLGNQPRLAQAIVGATALAGWDGGGPGSRMGLAAASAFGSHIGLVAAAEIGDGQKVTVERLTAVVDCGRAINPALVRQQVRGSLLHALSLATLRRQPLLAGMPIAAGLRAQGLGRALAVPEVTVELVPSRAAPGGISGLGHVVLAAAVANALASGAGLRLRSLPFDPIAA
jgi:isoquinoline 1-oxidoreductase beta subunit